MKITVQLVGALASASATLLIPAVPAAASPATTNQAVCELTSDAPAEIKKALDEVLPQVLESPLGSAAGAVISVKSDSWRYVAAAGLADPDAGSPMDCAMPFQIGSNTKMMTAVVVLQLVEEDRLGLDDPLSEHLPTIAARLPNGSEMTVRQLLQHTSGVFSYTDNAPDGSPGLMEGATTDWAALVRPLDPREMIEFVIDHGEPSFAPGAKGSWSYSNTGYILLGMMIEKIEGRPLGKSYENRIFDRLDMHASYMWMGIPKPEFGLPRAYLTGTEYETTDWNMSQGWSAGGVISTADDMHVFIEALTSGKLFRSPETLQKMKETVKSTNPTVSAYGLGLAVKAEGYWGHGGQTLGFESDVSASDSISIVAYGTSSSNLLGYGTIAITEALKVAE